MYRSTAVIKNKVVNKQDIVLCFYLVEQNDFRHSNSSQLQLHKNVTPV